MLRIWNIEVFGDIKRRKEVCLEEIQEWDHKEEFEGLVEDERRARKELRLGLTGSLL